MEKVAIIGMGISGMGVLMAYYNSKQKVELHCYDIKTSFSRGYPFRVDSNDVLLNVRPNQVTFDLEKPNDFINWLEENSLDYGEYVPRHVFGDYLSERTQNIIKDLNTHIFHHKVEQITYNTSDHKFIIDKNEYDRVHLCCGELPPLDFYKLNGTRKYLQTIYPVTQRFSDVKQDESVGIIGTALSSIDVSRYLLNNDKVKNIVLFSKDNVFPTTRGQKLELEIKTFTPEVVKNHRSSNNDFIDFEIVHNWVSKEMKHHKIDLNSLLKKYNKGFESISNSLQEDQQLDLIQSLYLALTDSFNLAWFGFTQEDKEKFNKIYQPLFTLFGAPTPKETGVILDKMYKQKRLKVVDDAIDVKYDEQIEKFKIIKSNNRIGARVNWLANATGLDTTFKSLRSNSLLTQLFNDELVQVGKNGGLCVLENTHQIISPRYGVIENLHAHGTLISGVQLINNDTSVIQESARKVIESI